MLFRVLLTLAFSIYIKDSEQSRNLYVGSVLPDNEECEHRVQKWKPAPHPWIFNANLELLSTIESHDILCKIHYSPTKKSLFIVFRGTDTTSTKNLVMDATFFHAPLSEEFGGKGYEQVHSGFQVAYALIRGEILQFLRSLDRDNYPVDTAYFVGHSLGGALAHFGFLDCGINKPALLSTARLNLCSFAAPAVGNAQFASLMQRVAGEEGEESVTTSEKHHEDWGNARKADARIILFTNRLDVVPVGLQAIGQLSSWLFGASKKTEEEQELEAKAKKAKASDDDFVHCVSPTVLGAPGDWAGDLSRSTARFLNSKSSGSSALSSSSGSIFDVGKQIISQTAKFLLDKHSIEEHIHNLEVFLEAWEARHSAKSKQTFNEF